MKYHVHVSFEPVHELMSSLHTYICRTSRKKIDLSPTWAEEVRHKLQPDFAAELDEMLVNGDWEFAYMLGFLAPEGIGINGFLTWLKGLHTEELMSLFEANGKRYPVMDLGQFHEGTLSLLTQWNEQYFINLDPAILVALEQEKDERNLLLKQIPLDSFIDDTTNGMIFKPIEGVSELMLVPQYHFQPLNIVSHFGHRIICHYNARLYMGDAQWIPTHDLRMIRGLGEKSRLKILRFLNQGPRTFMDIVNHMQLSKGITHDHISKLRSAGLLYAHFEGENLTEYSMRKRAFAEVQERLLRYIEQP